MGDDYIHSHPSPSARNYSSQQIDSTRSSSTPKHIAPVRCFLPTPSERWSELRSGSTPDPNLFCREKDLGAGNPPPLNHRRLIRPSTGTSAQTTSVSVHYVRLGPTEPNNLTTSTKNVSTACSLTMAAHSIAVGLAVLAGLGLLYSLLVALFSPLRNVPGPASARFTNLFYLNRVRHGRFHHENKALHRKYGPVLRLGEDLVSIDDPSSLKTIYGSKWLD